MDASCCLVAHQVFKVEPGAAQTLLRKGDPVDTELPIQASGRAGFRSTGWEMKSKLVFEKNPLISPIFANK
jgi:hypothetical protein